MDEIVKRPRGRPPKHPANTDNAPVQALERGLNLLKLLSGEHQISLSDLATMVNIPVSTTHRLLTTLQSHRFAEYDDANENWMIGVEAYTIGSAFLNRINVIEAAQPIMKAIVKVTGETANLAIMDDGEVVFVLQIESSNPIRASFPFGTRSPMHASGSGKILLAQCSQKDVEDILQRHGLQQFTEKTITQPADLFSELDRIRTKGWSFDDQERYAGMCCVAAPVFRPNSQPSAAVSVSGPSARFTKQSIADFSVIIRNAGKDISKVLGGKLS